MSKYCHYGCWFIGRCGGLPRAEVIEFLLSKGLAAPGELDAMTDDQLDEFSIDCEDGELGAPHIRRVG